MTNPGWHNDPSGSPNLRYWDGAKWTADTAPFPPPTSPTPFAPPPAAAQPWAASQPYFAVQPNVRQARDRAQYTRQQTGHSLIAHVLLGWVLLYIPTVYYAISPNHYFHA